MEENEALRQRTRHKRLRVTFPDGKVFCCMRSIATMIATLKEIGSDSLPQIDMTMCHLPLLSKTVYPKYEEWMKPVCDGWYVNTQSDTETKYMQLRSISDQLALGLVVEVGTDFELYNDIETKRKKRNRDSLQVTFPDGEIIDKGRATETYFEAIKKMGVDDVMRKHIPWGKYDLITSTQQTKYQVQLDEHRWLTTPSTTKEKAKILRVVSAMLRIKIDVTCG